MLDSGQPTNVLAMRTKRDNYLFDDPQVVVDLDEPEDSNANYDPLCDEFEKDDVDLTYHFLHRYKVFQLQKSLIELDWDDLVVFMLIEEEMGNAQAAQQLKLEQQSKNTQYNH